MKNTQMNFSIAAVTAAVAVFTTAPSPAATNYVWQQSPSPGPPYATWGTAAHTIQEALDAAQPGDAVLVTNGVYSAGGRSVGTNLLVNRVAINKAITVLSVNGPEVTIIEGAKAPGGTNGDGAIRCVYLADGATLSGFTLTNGATRDWNGGWEDRPGGGVWSASTNAVGTNCILTGNSATYGGGTYSGALYNCTLTGNSAYYGGGGCASALNNCTLTGNWALDSGGGACESTLYNCTLTGNSAYYGGGADNGTLNNCTLTGNTADYAGGASWSTLNNCIVYYNSARASGPNYDRSTLNYSCTTPMPPGGTGNITSEPALASASHLSASSPCRGAGNSAYATGVDIDGEVWLDPPCIGADQLAPGNATGPLVMAIEAAYTNVAAGFAVRFVGQNTGPILASAWDFGDGTVVSNQPWVSHAWSAPGIYTVRLAGYNDSLPGGMTTRLLVQVVSQPVHYVDGSNPGPVFPYTSWATAAWTIQEAVDAASTSVPGSLVLVSNGVYATGGRAVGTHLLVNRVAIDKPVRVESVNGPEVTIIQGCQVPGTTNGDGAIRCVYLTNGAVLSGFTLTNGATMAVDDYPLNRESSGGGLWCESTSATATNCTLTGNSACYGGGTAYGTLNNCTLSGNSASGSGGGACWGTLNNCTLTGNSAGSGGGAYAGTLYNCTVTGNSAFNGGGAAGWRGKGEVPCTLYNCTLTSNSADEGGGTHVSTLYNCALTGNSAGWIGGGAAGGELYNCTLTDNAAGWGGGGVATALYGGQVGSFPCPSTLYNCIVFYNTASVGPNFLEDEWSGPINYSCTTPMPTDGVGNITNEPALASASHLSADSPCRGAGSAAYATGVDIDSEAWGTPPSIGCDEFWPGAVAGPLEVAIMATYTNVAKGFTVRLTALIEGRTTASGWDFGDGVAVSNQPYISHAWTVPGDYAVVLRAYNDTYPEGVSATLRVHIFDAVYYVAVGSLNPTPPYSSWETAATNIQDAVDAAVVGGLVLASNGIYTTGGRAVFGLLTSRVAIDKPLTLRSVNGPEFTVIQGKQLPATTNADGAVRCVYLTNGAVLSGFTLTNGATRTSGDYYGEWCGGGVWCESTNALLTNCTLTGNSASSEGGGAYGGTLNNCTLTGNSAYYGGGACGGNLRNCTFTNNTAASGGGAYGGALYNCDLIGNSAAGANFTFGGGVFGSTLYNCTLVGNSAVNGGFSSGGGGAHGSTLYNCTLTGNSVDWGSGGGVSGSALYNCIVYGNTSPFGPNDAEWSPSSFAYSCTTPLPPGEGNIANEPAFVNLAAGDLRLRFGSPCIDAGTNLSDIITNDLTGNPRPLDGNGDGVAAFDMGAYEFVPPARYVWQDSPSPGPPYADWSTAAHVIQDAVDAAQPSDTVLVTNGVYATGGRAVGAALLVNRVAIDKPITLLSVNGPEVTIIEGAKAPGGTNGDGAIRCVYLTEGATLSGFTLTNGATRAVYDYPAYAESGGGGVWCASNNAVVTNCTLTGNSATYGGGVWRGGLYDCTLTGNSAEYGGGAAGWQPWQWHSGETNPCTLNNCTLTGNSARSGGGAYDGTLHNCTLAGNSAEWQGGGTYGGTLHNCTLTGHLASWGGGAAGGTLYNCTVTGNGAGHGGGVAGGTGNLPDWQPCYLYNCIVYHNAASSDPNYGPDSTFAYSCTTPLPPGEGNIDVCPAFVNLAAGDLRLRYGSPCIDTGTNLSDIITHDLTGNPRPLDGNGDGVAAFDMGAYEFDLRTTIPRSWCIRHGLDYDNPGVLACDPDHDGHTTYQEWVADTDPTDALSGLRIESISPGPPVAISVQSSAARLYTLESCIKLSTSLWTSVPGQTDIRGTGGPLTLTDSTADASRFYRISVRLP